MVEEVKRIEELLKIIIECANKYDTFLSSEDIVYNMLFDVQNDIVRLLEANEQIKPQEILKNQSWILSHMLQHHYEVSIYENSNFIEGTNIAGIIRNDANPRQKFLEAIRSPQGKPFLSKMVTTNQFYYDQTALYRFKCRENILQQGFFPYLLKMNPHAIISYLNGLQSSDFAESEFLLEQMKNIMKQVSDVSQFYDAYLDIEEDDILDALLSTNPEDSESLEDINEETLLELKREKYEDVLNAILNEFNLDRPEERQKVDQFLSYLISLAYENSQYKLQNFLGLTEKEHHQLLSFIQDIEKSKKDDLLTAMYEDELFFARVMDYIIGDINGFSETKLMIMRNLTKKLQHETVVRRINPFYDEEQKKWQLRIKKQQNILS